jgi:hypothetical protein
MTMLEVRVVPGFDTQKTPALAKAEVIGGQFIRWRDGIPEKLGGWEKFFPTPMGSIPRALQPWEDINGNLRLGVGNTASLKVITAGSIIDITPQTTTTNSGPNFATTSGSATVTIVDPNISNPSTNNSVLISTPISVGGLVLFGIYPIASVISSTSYTITAAALATSTVSTQAVSGSATWAATGGGQLTITTAAPTGVAVGANITVYGMTPAGYNGVYTTLAGTTGSTIVVSQPSNLGSGSGGTVCPGAVRTIATTNNSATVTVTLDNHGLSAGQSTAFLVSDTINGLTISGAYLVQAPVTANAYGLVINGLATSTGTAADNGGNVQFIYYIAIGPQSPYSGWGVGTWGGGGWGTGTAQPSGSGTPIMATDWSLINFGEVLIGNPAGGAIYQWGPESAFQNAQIISQAPLMADGIFLAQPQQIVVAWGASFNGIPNPLRLAWSDAGNFTNWSATSADFAGGYTIPRGSRIVGALQAPGQFLVWTDLSAWSGQYVGQPLVFSVIEVMTGCGLLCRKGAGVLGGTAYWISQKQFFQMPAYGAPQPLPCKVRDFIFQNLDLANVSKIRFFSNAEFNEIGWYFPSASGGTGENDSYIKLNVVEGEWDTGPLGRSAWTDQSVLGPPIGGATNGYLYQHELGYDMDGAAMNPQLQTGTFRLAEGEEFQVVDYVIPDFRYGLRGGAQTATLLITLQGTGFPSDTSNVQGPFTATASTPFFEPRLRSRDMSFLIQSQDLGSFWRAGNIRYRAAPDGRNP